VPHPFGVVSVHALVPLGQQAPLPSAPKQVPIEAHVLPLPMYVERPKLLVARPHPEAIVTVHAPRCEQQAPVMHGLVPHAVPTPWKVWLLAAAQPAMVLLEHTPAVEQHAPVRGVQGEGLHAELLPMYVSPEAPQAPLAPLPWAGLLVHVAPSELQHAPVGTVQGLGEQLVPTEVNVLGAAHAVPSVTVQAPLVPQQPPEVVVQGRGEQVEPRPAKLAGAAVVPQFAAVTFAVHPPVSGQQAPSSGVQTPAVQVEPMPRNVLVPEQLLDAVRLHDPVPLQHAPWQALGVHEPPEMKTRFPLHPVVVAVQVDPLQHAPVWACTPRETPSAAATIHSAAAQRVHSFIVMSPLLLGSMCGGGSDDSRGLQTRDVRQRTGRAQTLALRIKATARASKLKHPFAKSVSGFAETVGSRNPMRQRYTRGSV
jgi:hypothetical protein